MQLFIKCARGVLLPALLLGVLFASRSFAQAPTGNIRGEISDQSGGVIPEAVVKLTEVATGRVLEVRTNSVGIYAANLLLPGDYKLRIEAAGFKTYEQSVVLRAGDTVNINVKMEVGAAATTVEVASSAGQFHVDTTRATVDGVITAQQIDAFPLNARNFLELAALEPGVLIRDGGDVDPTKSGAYRTVGILGRSGTSTRVQMDGVDVTDESVGTTMANISDDAVQEFQLSQSSLDLTTSLTSSGAISVITRSGGNQVHGSGFWFYRNQDMGARLGFLTESNPPFKRTQAGYRAGGPFKKDKLFWFSNWERTYQTQQSIFTSDAVFPDVPFGSSNNCTNGCTGGVPFDVRLVTERLDWNIRTNMRAFYRFSHDMNLAAGGTIPVNPYQNVDWTNVHALGLDITTGRTSHSIRFGHVTFNNRIVSMEMPGFKFPATPNGIPYYMGVGAYVLGPNNLAPQATAQNNIQSKYDGTFVYGRHTFRWGFEVNRLLLGGFANFAGPLTVNADYSQENRNAIAAAGLNTGDPLNYPLSDFSGGPDNGFFSIDGCFKWAHGCHRNTRIAWYAGDTWKVRSNFTLNIGTRWEYDTGYFSDYAGVTVPDYTNYWISGYSARPRMGKDKFGPQIGFAWDPTGSGKTSIRGGYYLAYEMNIYNNLLFDLGAWLPSGIGPDLYTSSNFARADGTPITPAMAGVSSLPASCADATSQGQLAAGNYTCLVGQPTGSVIGIIGAVDKTMKDSYNGYAFDPSKGDPQFVYAKGSTYGFQVGGSNFKIPYSMQYNIGFQREVKTGHILTVDFLYNHGYHLPFLGVDLECRRCANSLNPAAAQSKVDGVLGGLTADEWIAANPGSNISAFGLASDSIFPGRTPDPTSSYAEIRDTNFLVNRTMLNGGVTAYTGVHINLRGQFGQHFTLGEHSLIKNMFYHTSWAIGRAESTDGAGANGRAEFLTAAWNKLNPHDPAFFGPTTLDRTHMITSAIALDTIAGFRLSTGWTIYSAPPLDLFIPAPYLAGSNQIFVTDANGDAGTGTTPFRDPIPGTHLGEFNRGVNSWADLNKVLANYNSTYAGQITPAGQALVKAGVFTEAQLKSLSAVMPTIALAPGNNPWPFNRLFNANLSIGRPIHLKAHENFVIEPWLQIFNLFNHTGLRTYGGLGGTFGSLNFNYHDPANESICGGNCVAALDAYRTRNADTRLMQLGVRVTF